MAHTPAVAAGPVTPRTWRPTLTVLGAIAAIIMLFAAGSTLEDRVPPAVGHALSHLALTLPLVVLLFAALRRWPAARATRPGRLGRRIVVIGLAGIAAGQALEVAGARVDEPGALAVEEIAHTAGQIVSMLSLPVLLIGTLTSLVAAAREGAVPWWVVALIGIAGVGLFTFMIIGAPDGS